jgi:hypothetical protein
MAWLPDKIYRFDRQRETVWEALDRLEPGRPFTLDDVWRGRLGYVSATYSMTRNVVADAVRLGYVEHLGRLSCHGAPNVYRRVL